MNTIDIRITIPTDLKSTALAKAEELAVRSLIQNNKFVKSAVVLRTDPRSGSVGWSRMLPDESTRQEQFPTSTSQER